MARSINMCPIQNNGICFCIFTFYDLTRKKYPEDINDHSFDFILIILYNPCFLRFIFIYIKDIIRYM